MSITVRVNGVIATIQTSDVPATSPETIKEYSTQVPNCNFVSCQNVLGMHETSLKHAFVQLDQMGPALSGWQQVALSVIAVAGVVLLGMAAFSVIAAATGQALLLTLAGLPLAGVCTYKLYEDEQRDKCTHHVKHLFTATMAFYANHGAALKAKIDPITTAMEDAYVQLVQTDRAASRAYHNDPANRYAQKLTAQNELDQNVAFFNRFQPQHV
jgi:hypothetical protein